MNGGREMGWENYQVMTGVKETLQRLTQGLGGARVIAGGTDLMVQIREREGIEGIVTLLDVTQINEMRGIRESGGHLYIGAATTISELVSSELIQKKARALFQGGRSLGSLQIRNVATIGGNVVNAQPAADTSIPLIALGAEGRIVSSEGERTVPVEELFRGAGLSAIDPSREILTQFKVPISESPKTASAMERLARRKTFTLPTLSVAVWIELDDKGDHFSQARIVAAPVSPIPWRATRAEQTLKKAAITRANVSKAAAIAREDANPRESLRGGADYRKDMMEILTHRAFVNALSSLNKELHD
jgi:carbon-monoxide dehydrogenase medium subunit